MTACNLALEHLHLHLSHIPLNHIGISHRTIWLNREKESYPPLFIFGCIKEQLLWLCDTQPCQALKEYEDRVEWLTLLKDDVKVLKKTYTNGLISSNNLRSRWQHKEKMEEIIDVTEAISLVKKAIKSLNHFTQAQSREKVRKAHHGGLTPRLKKLEAEPQKLKELMDWCYARSFRKIFSVDEEKKQCLISWEVENNIRFPMKSIPENELRILFVDGEILMIDRSLWIASSNVFEVLLNGAFAESKQKRVELNDIRLQTFNIIYYFIEYGWIPDLSNHTPDQLIELISKVRYFDLSEKLEKACFAALNLCETGIKFYQREAPPNQVQKSSQETKPKLKHDCNKSEWKAKLTSDCEIKTLNILKNPSICQIVTCLDLQKKKAIGDEMLKEFIPLLPSIKKLVLPHHHKLSQAALNTIKKLENLQTIVFKGEISKSQVARNVKALKDWKGERRYKSADAEEVVAETLKMKEMVHVKFFSMPTFTSCTIDWQTRGKEVKFLNLNRLKLSDDWLENVATHCTNLRSLEIASCSHFTDWSLITTAKKCTKLKTLILYNCYTVSDQSMLSFANHCTKLEVLHLFGNDQLTDEGCLPLAHRCTRLTHVTLRLSGITPLTIFTFKEYGSNLMNLSLN